MRRRDLPSLAVIGFLLPNFLGFLIFTLFPIILSLVMAVTNWSLKPAVEMHWVGLRNFTDMLGVHAVGEGDGSVGAAYIGAALVLLAGMVGVMWAAVNQWRGTRVGGVVLMLLGGAMVVQLIAAAAVEGAAGGALGFSWLGLEFGLGGGQGVAIAGLALLLPGAKRLPQQ
jgi:multiple sugar transport system permease protein